MKRATDVFAVAIAVAGFSVSYTTQALLASAHGFIAWEAWLWPAIADAAALCMILRLHFGLVRPGWYVVEAWSVFAFAAAVMIVANTIADLRDPLSGAMHGVVPIVAMAVWHVVIHGRPALETKVSHRPAPIAGPMRDTRRRIQRLIERRPQVTAGETAKRLGVSRSHAARLLSQARRPRVVSGDN